jgi:HlyD family secretion protein
VWKWILGVFVLCVAVCGGGGYFAYSSPQGKEWLQSLRPQDKPKEVRLEDVKRGDLVRTVNAPGTIEPRTNVKISAQVSARILALPFRETQEVKKGDVVVRLDAQDLTARLESAQASRRSEEARLEGANALLERTTAEVKRQRDLYEAKVIAKSALDAAENEFRQADSLVRQSGHAVEIARANIVRAEKDLENTIIKSPIDGTITALNAEVGETVVVGTTNNPGSVIMEIGDLSEMIMKAKVDESNIGPVRVGQRCKIFVNASQDKVFTGAVDRVGMQKKIDKDQTTYFEVEILVELPKTDAGTVSPEALTIHRSGLTANTDIEVETIREVIKVPSQAVLDRRVDELPKDVVDSSTFVDRNKVFARVVYILDAESKAAASPVSIGTSDLTHTVIIGGLTEGQKIITGPYKLLTTLKHGDKVAEEGTIKKAKDNPLPPATAAK